MWCLCLPLAAVLLLKSCGGEEQPPPWWDNAIFYRLLVDSFTDQNSDGLGDLEGLSRRISYLGAVGASAVVLSPLGARSTDCSVPGVLDFNQIDPRYGDLEHLESVLNNAIKADLKTLITLPLQTISVASPWFAASANRSQEYEDYVMWAERDDNNTEPEDYGFKWKWNETRGAYYGSINDEAILNFCSESLAVSLAEAQCAWLRRGMAGVLLNPDFTPDRSCGEQLLKKLVSEARRCAIRAGLETPVILVETSLPPEIAANYYAVGASSVLSDALTQPWARTAPELALAFYNSLLNTPQDMASTWMTSSSNRSRIVTRYGRDMVDAINLLALTLPGMVLIQQGDELGIEDIPEESCSTNSCWPISPSPAACPFSWTDEEHAGFTRGTPWLPVAPNIKEANAKAEFKSNISHLNVVRVAAAMRKSPAFGEHTEIKCLGKAIAILRWGDIGSLLVVANLGSPTEVQLSRIPGLPAVMTVAAASIGSSLISGAHVSIKKALKLSTGETVLLVGPPRHCGGPGPVDKIANKLSQGWQKINNYFNNP